MELPDGFDDADSRFFIEPELRPIYSQLPEVAPRDAVWIVKDFARFEPAASMSADVDDLREAHRNIIQFALHWHYLMKARAQFRMG